MSWGCTKEPPSEGFHVLTLESDCGCEPGSFTIMGRFGKDQYKPLHLYENNTVYIPKENDEEPFYDRITGVSVISIALRPTPTRLRKMCPPMPYLPEQANWVQPQDGNVIPIFCY